MKKSIKSFAKRSLKDKVVRYYPLHKTGNRPMELKIVWDNAAEMWEVRIGETGSLEWRGELRRDAVFYARDREDDPSDAIDKIVAFNRDGTIAWGG